MDEESLDNLVKKGYVEDVIDDSGSRIRPTIKAHLSKVGIYNYPYHQAE